MRFTKLHRSLFVLGLAAVTCSSAFATEFAILLRDHATRCADVTGGQLLAEVFTDPNDQGQTYVKKHIANIKWNDIAVQMGFDDPDVNKAIGDMSSGKGSRKSGSIIILNDDHEAINENFVDALITEVGFPSVDLDGASKDPGYLKMTISPNAVAREKTNPNVLRGLKQKLWTPSNFRLQLGDLPCRRVSKIESFSMKQSMVKGAGGDQPQLECTDFVFWMNRNDAAPFKAWFDLTMQLHLDQPKAGSLTYLDDRNKEMGTMQFSSMMISDCLGDVDMDGRPDRMVRVTCAVSGAFKWFPPDTDSSK